MTLKVLRPKKSLKKKKKNTNKIKKRLSKKGGFLREFFSSNITTPAGVCSANDTTACESTNKLSEIRQQQQSDAQFDKYNQPVLPAADNTNKTTQCQSDTNYSQQQFKKIQQNYCDAMARTRGTRCGGARKKKSLRLNRK